MGSGKTTFLAEVIFKTPWEVGIERKKEVGFGHGFESSYWLENLIAVFLILCQERCLNWNPSLSLR